jgi:2-phosphosulfolactate phosphatase
MKPSIDIIATAQLAETVTFDTTIAVVVDVLRATTSIHCALTAGANTVHPVESVAQARMMKADLPDALLCGERNGMPPSGFDLGNSPADFAVARLEGKDIILTTTNGTLAVSHASPAQEVVAATMLNVISVADHILRHSEKCYDVSIICAGTDGRFSIEDFYCAGAIVSALATEGYGVPTDQAWAASKLSDLPMASVVNRATCRHVAVLERKGFGRDLELALRMESEPYGRRIPVLDQKTGGFVLSDETAE